MQENGDATEMKKCRIDRNAKNLNAILFVQNSSVNRLTPDVIYYLNRFSEMIPKEFENHIILLLSFCAEKEY